MAIDGVFPPNTAVCQGCPLSIKLLTLDVNPLIKLLTKRLPGVQIGHRNTQTSVIAYADAITLLLTNSVNFHVAMDLIQVNGGAKGTGLNISKSKPLTFGSWNSSALQAKIPYPQVKSILGVRFASTSEKSRQITWSKVTG